MENNNKTILIAGCAGEAGRAAGAIFRERGWKVIGLDLCETFAEADRYDQCDVRDIEQIRKIVKAIEKESPLDALFHAAGVKLERGFEETGMDDWNRLLDTVLGGAANLCRAAAPYMIQRKRGKIVLLSPDYKWEDRESIMEATAAGTLHGFAKSFGVEIAASNVLVNALSPNIPFDLEALAESVYYLADQDNYTTAQVISIGGVKEKEVPQDEI